MSENKCTVSIPTDVVEEAVKELRQMERFAGMSDAEIIRAALTAGVNKHTQ